MSMLSASRLTLPAAALAVTCALAAGAASATTGAYDGYVQYNGWGQGVPVYTTAQSVYGQPQYSTMSNPYNYGYFKQTGVDITYNYIVSSGFKDGSGVWYKDCKYMSAPPANGTARVPTLNLTKNFVCSY